MQRQTSKRSRIEARPWQLVKGFCEWLAQHLQYPAPCCQVLVTTNLRSKAPLMAARLFMLPVIRSCRGLNDLSKNATPKKQSPKNAKQKKMRTRHPQFTASRNNAGHGTVSASNWTRPLRILAAIGSLLPFWLSQS